MSPRTLRTSALLAVLGLVCLSSSASAQTRSQVRAGDRLNVLAGSVSPGQSNLHFQVGWPGIGLSYLTGVSDRLSAGARFGFNYAYEGISGASRPGLKLQGLLRVALTDTGKVQLNLEMSPGGFVYFTQVSTFFGIVMPLRLALVVPVIPELSLHAAAEVPMTIQFAGGAASFALPFLMGGGLEYTLTPELSLTVLLQMGPYINVSGGGALFALNGLFGLALKL